MTPEEALKYIDEADVDILCRGDFWQTVKSALEKQIPKKVEKTEHGYECPSCKAFWATFKGNFIDTNYCPNCGQRIDWGDVDDE